MVSNATGWGSEVAAPRSRSADEYLLTAVDCGLAAIVLVAPYIFGGRHDLGRFVLVLLIAVTSLLWFVRQAMRTSARFPSTFSTLLLLLAVVTLTIQILPLPASWLEILSPRISALLPSWSSDGATFVTGTWHTISLTPHETAKSLAMLLSYLLLFVVVAGRIEERRDIERLLQCMALSAVVMAIFGIFHYFASNGRYFWFYQHPYRSPTSTLAGPFINRNHFAHFLVLGVGPLAGWLLTAVRSQPNQEPKPRNRAFYRPAIVPMLLSGGFVLVLLTTLLTISRGGVVALSVALVVAATVFARAGMLHSSYRWAILGLGCLIFGLLSLYGYDELSDRLSTLTSGSIAEIDSREGRRKIWAANAAAIAEGGAFGSGAGSHREVYPVYLADPVPFVYSHAESGYLQIVTENGLLGAILLGGGLAFVGCWLLKCFHVAQTDSEQLCFGAIAAGLAASAVHSIADFVWYIPACMSVTIMLAACALRLAQLSDARKNKSGRYLPPARWWELVAAGALVGGWCTYTLFGPAMASIHWNRYLRASTDNMELSRHQWRQLVAGREVDSKRHRVLLNDAMIRHLERVVDWDPQFARARLQLAAKYIARFELQQSDAPNAMTRAHIRDAALASEFASQNELDAWLEKACGENIRWLRQAAIHAREAVALCPLQGEGYLYLADLAFLYRADSELASRLIDQALLVRPYDSAVQYVVGERAWQLGNIELALGHWARCFGDSGPHQLRIIYWLAGPMPADAFLATFRPDWRMLSQIWNRYKELNRREDLEALLAYAAESSPGDEKRHHGMRATHNWSFLSRMYSELDRENEALACLQRAYAADPADFNVRQQYAMALLKAGALRQAESHLRWCLARRPTHKPLSDALVRIAKLRATQHDRKASLLNSSPHSAASAPQARASTQLK